MTALLEGYDGLGLLGSLVVGPCQCPCLFDTCISIGNNDNDDVDDGNYDARIHGTVGISRLLGVLLIVMIDLE